MMATRRRRRRSLFGRSSARTNRQGNIILVNRIGPISGRNNDVEAENENFGNANNVRARRDLSLTNNQENDD
jgi:hypothetical protein